MKVSEEVNNNRDREAQSALFTNFEDKFSARLSAVIPIHVTNTTENAPISAKYDCRIKAAYHKDLMGLLEEGMILAVKNFRTKLNDNNSGDGNNESQRYTLLIASRIWPDHYGLRALSDQTYYPMQFEVIEQSVGDWDTDDKSTMMIQISAIPINYDLVVRDNGKYEYVKGFSYPLIGDQVFVLNAETVGDMYNKKVLDKVQWGDKVQHASLSSLESAHDSPRIGIIRMFENSKEKIPIFVNFDHMVRYHFGLFSFTGGGKSNLLSNLLRKVLLHTSYTKVVLFDISCEYPFLLMDLFADTSIESKIILERPVKDPEQFYISVVKPREYEDDGRVKEGLTKVYERGIVKHFVKPQFVTPTCKDIFDELDKLKSESIDKPHYVDAINDIRKKLIECMTQSKLLESNFIDQNFVQILSKSALEAMKTYKVSDKAGLHAWASSRDTLLGRIKPPKGDDNSNEDDGDNGITTDEIFNLIEGKSRLICISISDPYTIKELVLNLTDQFLHRRKQQFKVKPYILFVFDEAQEFVADLTNSRGIDKECSQAVETLLRQGRKYGLGGCIATQRIAYLNTSALQQLHTYFVGTLPRPYDRNVVSNTFTIDQQILEKTLEFAPGEWLLSSYIATGIENVPIFIRADNSENEIAAFINQIST